MKSLNVWVAAGASLGLACGADVPPPDAGATHAAGHAGVSSPTAGAPAGGATSSGASPGAGTSGQSGRGNGGTTSGGTTSLGGAGAATSGGAGASAGSSGLAGGTIGGTAGAGGAGNAGDGGTFGGADAGSRSTGGWSGAGGAQLGGGAGATAAGSAGRSGAGGGAGTPFACNQVTGGQLVEEWFIAGFEQVVDDRRWQVKWRVDGYLEEWANPQSSFWTAPVDSACANGSTPDRIVFPVVSWAKRAQTEWVKTIEQALTTFQAKYPGIRRVDLMTQVRGPNNMLCPTAPTQGETIVVPPELDAALDDVAEAHPGFVFVGPRVEARSCSDIQGGGPHLTSAGNIAAAVPISSYFVNSQ